MKTELLFKNKKIIEELPGIPRAGDVTRLDVFDRDLRVERVVWTREGVSWSLEIRQGGHVWVREEDGWACQRCGWFVLSSVPPEHPNFPGSEAKKTYWLRDCDEEIAKTVHME